MSRAPRLHRCWYCAIRLVKTPNRPDSRTTEHLIAIANGGLHERRNVRLACQRCNTFVGNWPLEDKLKFRVLAHKYEGWPGLKRRFAPRIGRVWRIRCALAHMNSPTDGVSVRARALLGVREPSTESSESEPPIRPQRVIVDTAPYLATGGVGPDSRHVAQWSFRIGDEKWSVAGPKTYSNAVRLAVAKAVKEGVETVEVLAPKG